MNFEIRKVVSVNRTIRMNNEMLERMDSLASKNGISFNQLVVQCCDFALTSMQGDSTPADTEDENAK